MMCQDGIERSSKGSKRSRGSKGSIRDRDRDRYRNRNRSFLPIVEILIGSFMASNSKLLKCSWEIDDNFCKKVEYYPSRINDTRVGV